MRKSFVLGLWSATVAPSDFVLTSQRLVALVRSFVCLKVQKVGIELSLGCVTEMLQA